MEPLLLDEMFDEPRSNTAMRKHVRFTTSFPLWDAPEYMVIGKDDMEDKKDIVPVKPSKPFGVVEHRISQTHLPIFGRKYLRGILYTSEKIDTENSELKYLPIVKAAIVIPEEKGLFGPKTVRSKVDIFVDSYNFDILNIGNQGIRFITLPRINVSLNNDFASTLAFSRETNRPILTRSDYLGHVRETFSERDNDLMIQSLAERYKADVLTTTPVLLPVWKCKIADRAQNERELYLDGVYGLKMTPGRSWNV